MRHYKLKSCLSCSKLYTPKRVDSVSCSKDCSIKAQNIKRSEKKKEWNAFNKEKVRESKDRWVKENPEKRKEDNARKNNKFQIS